MLYNVQHLIIRAFYKVFRIEHSELLIIIFQLNNAKRGNQPHSFRIFGSSEENVGQLSRAKWFPVLYSYFSLDFRLNGFWKFHI